MLVLVALTGCQSVNETYTVEKNTVTGYGVGHGSFTFDIPDGYEIYDERAHGASPITEFALKRAENYLYDGNTPYMIPLISEHAFLVLLPTNSTASPRYRRVSDMHSQAVMFDFSRLNEQDKLHVLRAWVDGINLHGDDLQNIQRGSELYNGVPLGVFTATLSHDNGFIELSSLMRLGTLRDQYLLLGVGTASSFGQEVYDSKKLLGSITFGEAASPPSTGPASQP